MCSVPCDHTTQKVSGSEQRPTANRNMITRDRTVRALVDNREGIDMATNDELAAMLARELAQIDGMEEDGLFSLRWSGGTCPEPVGDAWQLVAGFVARQIGLEAASVLDSGIGA